MLRVEGKQRVTKHEGHQVYDLWHVWPSGFVANGVKYLSIVTCYLAEPTKPSARVRMWAPGGMAGDLRELRWGEEWSFESKGFGIVSAVCEDNVPLNLIWELTAGKA